MKPRKPIESLILNLRGQKVILDADLAELYDVPTYRFNEAFKRNRQRFPDDFAFQLTAAEFAALRDPNSSQFAMSSPDERALPNWSQFATSFEQADRLDLSGRQIKGWTNKLIWGDNKLILASLKAGALRRQIEDVGGLRASSTLTRPSTWARTSAWTSRLAARPSTKSRTSSNKPRKPSGHLGARRGFLHRHDL